jgi:hypothetical protein
MLTCTIVNHNSLGEIMIWKKGALTMEKRTSIHQDSSALPFRVGTFSLTNYSSIAAHNQGGHGTASHQRAKVMNATSAISFTGRLHVDSNRWHREVVLIDVDEFVRRSDYIFRLLRVVEGM